MIENERFTVGLRKNTTQYELIDNYKTGEYPFICYSILISIRILYGL